MKLNDDQKFILQDDDGNLIIQSSLSIDVKILGLAQPDEPPKLKISSKFSEFCDSSIFEHS